MLIYTKKQGDKLIFTVEQSNSIEKYLKRIKEGSQLTIEIKKFINNRTLAQNRLYWLHLNIIGDELGYSADELHDSYKAMFLTDRSKKIPLVRSTTVLDTKQFTTYMELIRKHAGELGITLPTDLDDYIQYENKYKI